MSDRKCIPLIPFENIEIGGEPEFLIEGLIPSEGLVVCWGPPKSYKSFWAYDASMHVALGWEYRGRRVQQGPVVYSAFEGQHGFKKRIVAYRQRFLKDHHEPVLFYLQPKRLDLIKDIGSLIDAIRGQLDGVNPILITLDTLNRSLVGSESKDEDMSAYLAAADRLREEFHCAVLIVHHCGVETGRPRGHTSLSGAADAQLAVKRTGKTSTLTVEFMKDGDEGDVLFSQLEVVDVGRNVHGDPIISCVLVKADPIAASQTSAKCKGPTGNNRIALDALTKALLKDGRVPPVCNDIPGYTPCVSEQLWHDCIFKALPHAETKHKNQAIKRGVTWLIANHYVGQWNGLVWSMGRKERIGGGDPHPCHKITGHTPYRVV
jgi:hypothetical protein